ncbi:MAG: Zn-ribbon domain-containing OB-fold protein [Pseudomonadota bacterium]
MDKHFHALSHQVWLPYKFAVGQTFYRFYEGLKEKKILGNQCPKCGKIFVPARSFCPICVVDMGDWKEVSQEGEVMTWTLCNYEFYGMPVDPPFIGALIRLDGTDCDFLHLIGGIELKDLDRVRDQVRQGTKVSAVWSENRKGHMLDIRYFKPV